MIRTFFLPPQDIRVPEKQVLARSGIPSTEKPPEELHEYFSRAVELVSSVATPEAVYETLKAEWKDKTLVVHEIELSGKLVREQLDGVEYVTLMAATLGHSIDNLVSTLMESGETLLAFFCDAYASELVESFVRGLDAKLRRDMSKHGYVGTARLSPGYVDLPLSLNEVIARHLKAQELIELTVSAESGQLDPRKSVIAVMGWKRG
ncbi:MAG: hypothetical protein DRP27_04490 [Thermotogae bacterium]|nr:MAG: hypothetical protein DRP27_04490 [Thermotogota bacterium]